MYTSITIEDFIGGAPRNKNDNKNTLGSMLMQISKLSLKNTRSKKNTTKPVPRYMRRSSSRLAEGELTKQMSALMGSSIMQQSTPPIKKIKKNANSANAHTPKYDDENIKALFKSNYNTTFFMIDDNVQDIADFITYCIIYTNRVNTKQVEKNMINQFYKIHFNHIDKTNKRNKKSSKNKFESFKLLIPGKHVDQNVDHIIFGSNKLFVPGSVDTKDLYFLNNILEHRKKAVKFLESLKNINLA